MLKPWKELSKLDVSAFTEEREDEKGNTFAYLPWVKALSLLYENGAQSVKMGVTPDERGNSVHMTELGFTDKNGAVNHCPEVHVWVEIDGERYEYTYPVISGSYVVKDATLNQQRIATAVIRAQVKCIAINTGLGISLWEKGDEVEISSVDVVDMQSVDKLFAKFGTMCSRLMDHDMTETEIAIRLGFDSDRVGDIIKAALAPVKKYERELNKMLKEVEQ